MKKQSFDFILQLRLKKNRIFFGTGIAELLQGVEKNLSLSAAAKNMYMAYSKAWRIVKCAEKELGFPLTTRQSGGIGGGGSVLTQEGKKFLHQYLAFKQDCFEYTKHTFEKYFNDEKI